MRSALLSLLLLPLLSPLATEPAQAAPAVTPQARAASLDLPLGHDRIGVRRGDTWYLRPDLGPGAAETYREHVGGWVPVSGDTDGDGNGSVSLFKGGTWRISDSREGGVREVRFGMPGDLPVLGDWDADGVDTIGVYRSGRFYLRDANSGGPARVVGFGIPGDVPVVGDWDGDGGTDIGVKRGRTWYQRDAADGGPASRTIAFGLARDLPAVGDWDHDGKDTIAAFRDGTWFLRDAGGTYQQTRFGLRGDVPVVRRTQGLAPGVTHRVLRDPRGWVAHVVTVDLAASSTPDVVVGRDRLAGTELTSSMGRRSGAVVAVNGDYATSDGRPVHGVARDGRLLQSPSLLGKALGFDLGASRVPMGPPDLTVTVQPDGTAEQVPVSRWNQGQPETDQLVAFTAAGATVESPRSGACYAGLTDATPVVRNDVVETSTTVTGRRCFGDPALVPPTGTLLTANTFAARQAFVEALAPGQSLVMRQTLGFPGAVDLLGGNPMLVVEGSVPSGSVDGTGSFFGPNPRTAVGATVDGRLILVVVDGRRSGYSTGVSLRDLADLMVALGAHDAINLDGGGSSTMWLNGVVANRPSDSRERGVSSALVVLPAGDPGEEGLTSVASPPQASRRAAAPVTPPVPVAAVAGPADSLERAWRDPASSAGLVQLR